MGSLLVVLHHHQQLGRASASTGIMSKVSAPELKKYMDKLLFVDLQGGRKVSGVLRGFDIFLNLVIDDCRDESSADKVHIGTAVIRGSSVTTLELLAART